MHMGDLSVVGGVPGTLSLFVLCLQLLVKPCRLPYTAFLAMHVDYFQVLKTEITSWATNLNLYL